MAAYRIFISYSRVDSDFVDQLEADLRLRSFSTWVDRQQLEGGDDWAAKIQTEIDQCDCVLVVLSPEAAASEWVRREISYAQSLKKRIIPLNLRTVQRRPIQIYDLNWIDFSKNYQHGFSKLLASLPKNIIPTQIIIPTPSTLEAISPKDKTAQTTVDVAPTKSIISSVVQIPDHNIQDTAPRTAVVSPKASVTTVAIPGKKRVGKQSRLAYIIPVIIVVIIVVSSFTLYIRGGLGSVKSPSPNKSLKIGILYPITDYPTSQSIQNGAILAVENAKLDSGYTVTAITGDDSDSLKNRITLATSLIADSSVVAMVGPDNVNSIANDEITLTNAASLPMISPTNTEPGLTNETYAGPLNIDFPKLHPSNKKNAFFQIGATDDIHAKVDASIVYRTLPNAKSDLAIDDLTPTGNLQTTEFINNFKSLSGIKSKKISITPDSNSNDSNSNKAYESQIVYSSPDFVFFGGVSTTDGEQLKKTLVATGGSNIIVFGGDNIANDPMWLSQIGSAAGAMNTYGISSLPNLSNFSTLAQMTFISQYKARFNADPLPASALAYDCAMIEIQAINTLIKDGKDVTRANIRDVIQNITYNGLTGTISFDANGDIKTQKTYTIYKTDTTGHWVAADTYTYPK